MGHRIPTRRPSSATTDGVPAQHRAEAPHSLPAKAKYAVQMAISDKRKQSLYFPEEMLKEIGAEATRQDRSLSWIVQKAWKAARKDIMNIPSVADSPDDQVKDGVGKVTLQDTQARLDSPFPTAGGGIVAASSRWMRAAECDRQLQ